MDEDGGNAHPVFPTHPEQYRDRLLLVSEDFKRAHDRLPTREELIEGSHMSRARAERHITFLLRKGLLTLSS